MSYVELVTDIRYCVSGDKPCGECKHIEELCCDTKLMEDAADAIEQLEKDLERAKEWASFWEKEANEALKKFQVAVASKPRWISVTERLPEERTWVLCQCRAKIREVLRWQDGGWYHDPQHKYMSGFVTHWMPLPEPPKEENGND